MTMITIYEIGSDGLWTGNTTQIGEHAGAPAGWTRTAPPTLGEGEVAAWTGEDWAVATPLSTPSLAQHKAARLAVVRTLRHQVESAGVDFGGLRIRTDVSSQTKIAGAVQLLANDPTLASIDWEAQPGQWVTVDRATMAAIGVAVGRHVQACFTRTRVLQEAIEAAPDLAALETIVLVTGWPGGGAIAPM